MKTIKILPDLTELVDSSGAVFDDAPVVSHRKFILDRLTDSVFTQDFDGLCRGMVIRELCKNTSGDLVLEDSDWTLLSVAARRGYNAAIAHNFIPFIKAILEAT